MIAGFAALVGVVIGALAYLAVAKWYYERQLRRKYPPIVWDYERMEAERAKFWPPEGKWRK